MRSLGQTFETSLVVVTINKDFIMYVALLITTSGNNNKKRARLNGKTKKNSEKTVRVMRTNAFSFVSHIKQLAFISSCD